MASHELSDIRECGLLGTDLRRIFRRAEVKEFFERLSEDPSLPGDFAEVDVEGHEFRTKVVGGYAIVWSVDAVARRINIERIDDAD
jgi:hypothetical protein